MPATNQAVTHWAGDSLVIRFPIKAPDGSSPNLAESKGRWRLAKSVYAGTLVTKSTVDIEGGGAVLTSTGGVWSLVVTLAPGDTDQITPSPPTGYYHEAEIVDSDGNVSTIATGPFKLMPTIVRPPV